MNAVARFLIRYLGIPLALKLGEWIIAFLSRQSELLKLRAENEKLKADLEKAQSEKERDDATQNMADRFNRNP